jgi:hypothetical protein
MSDEWEPTGVWDAVLIDVLLRLGHGQEMVMTMSAQERIDTVAAARRDGRLDDQTIEMLTEMRILAAED